MIRTAIIAIAAALTIAGAASAETINFSASPFPQTHQSQVRLSDIDLSTASGARVALVRIQGAAMSVCGGAPDERASDNELLEFRTCYAKAVQASAENTHAPVLVAMVRKQAPSLMAQN